MNRLLKVGISHGSGDTNSYELLTRLLAVPELMELCTPVVVGNVDAANQANNGPEPIKWNVINKLQDLAEGRANIFERYEGEADAATLQAAEAGLLQVVVAPATPTDGTALGALRIGDRSYFNPELGDETTATLLDAVRRIHAAMRRDFTELRPRIAVILPSQSQLETTVLHDVCRTLREEGILAFGPLSEESFEAQSMAAHYDAIVVPGDAQTLERLTRDARPDETFRYVTERPYIQVAPMVQPDIDDTLDSLHCALYAALDIWVNRRRYAYATRSPLEKQWNPRGKDDVKLDLTKDVDAD
jgi:hypothetical protein